MSLARFIVPVRATVVVSQLGTIGVVIGALFAFPVIVALAVGDRPYAAIFAGIGAFTYVAGRRAQRYRAADINLKEAVAVTALGYGFASLLGALAFLPVAGFLDGWFEAMSGFTTTGLSVVPVDRLSPTLLFFRAYAQWIGGAGIVVLSIVVLAGPGQTAFRLYGAEVGGESLVGSVRNYARVVTRVYAFITVAGILVFVLVGMPPFDALLHAMAAVSTGGFSPHGAGMAHYADRPSILAVAMVLMVLGATPLALYAGFARRSPLARLRGDLQVRYLLGLIAIAALAVIAAPGAREAWLPALFHTVSSVTTSGFNMTDTSQWSESVKLQRTILMMIGGTEGSTAGGIKLLRLIILTRLAWGLLLSTLLPREALIPIKYGRSVVAPVEQRQVAGVTMLYVVLLVLSALALVTTGASMSDALFESASAIGTVGLSSGVTSAALHSGGKLVLILDMWAGRLEILPLLLVLYPRTWLRRRA